MKRHPSDRSVSLTFDQFSFSSTFNFVLLRTLQLLLYEQAYACQLTALPTIFLSYIAFSLQALEFQHDKMWSFYINLKIGVLCPWLRQMFNVIVNRAYCWCPYFHIIKCCIVTSSDYISVYFISITLVPFSQLTVCKSLPVDKKVITTCVKCDYFMVLWNHQCC